VCAKHLWAEKIKKKLKKEKKEKKKKKEKKEKENDECECSNVAYDSAANRVLTVARQSVSFFFFHASHVFFTKGLRAACVCVF